MINDNDMNVHCFMYFITDNIDDVILSDNEKGIQILQTYLFATRFPFYLFTSYPLPPSPLEGQEGQHTFIKQTSIQLQLLI